MQRKSEEYRHAVEIGEHLDVGKADVMALHGKIS